MSELIQAHNLSKTYNDGAKPVEVLKNVNFQVSSGEQVAIVGSSGSGKSTLLHLLGALDSPTSGEVLFQGQNIFALNAREQARFRNQQLGFVYQFHHLLPEFSALENVAMPLLIGKVDKAEALRQASAVLEQVGLAERAEHRPAALSGGERQRVAIARAIVAKPALVLADEPTGNLDQKTGESIYQLLRGLKDSLNTSFVIVTHDNQLAAKLDRTLHIVNGHLSESGEHAGA